jgi:membrane carboxypeptidase/penicillin-binding protein
MPSVPQIVGYREKRRKRARNYYPRKSALPTGAFLSLAAAGIVILLSFSYVQLVQGLPSLDAIQALLEPPDGLHLQPTRLYDRTGQNLILVLENPAAEGKRYLYYPYPSKKNNGVEAISAVSINKEAVIPRSLILATIASRDPGLWKHFGFSIQGLLTNSRPTLAQQLAFELLLAEEAPGLERNLRERLYAAQITAHFGREKILEWNLNSAHYGDLIYGADAAARVYFGKPADRLSLAEAAVLAAISEAPSISPLSSPKPVLERQKEIIHSMLEQELISEEEAQSALVEEMVFQTKSGSEQTPASDFNRMVIEYVSKQIEPAKLERGGLDITTTLDQELQYQIHCVIENQLSRMRENQGQWSQVWEDGECSSARLLPVQSFLADIATLELAGRALVLDQKTGQILAMTGSGLPGDDPIRQTGQPPGSLITPFIYLTAFTRGFSPASLVWDIPESLPEEVGFEQEKYSGPMRIRTAFSNDYLIPSIQTLGKVGPENVWSILQQLGVISLSQPAINGYLTQLPLLSGGEVTLLEMGRAFGVLANQGLMAGVLDNPPGNQRIPQTVEPVTVLKVTDRRGQVWIDCQEEYINCHQIVRPIVSPELSFLVNEMMSDEPARWPSLGHPNPLEIGRPAAAKMGTTGSPNSTWTIGYTPHLTAAVWIGDISGIPVGETWSPAEEQSLSSGAAGLWQAIMKYASQDLPPDHWVTPPGVVHVDVCDPSGLLPTVHCPSVVREVFLAGNEPTHQDTLYKVYQINRETGRLATVYTPPGLVEEKVFFIVPPEGSGWSRIAGLPLPPDMYDVIALPPTTNPEAIIASPNSFSHVSGKVSITGAAAGKNFSFYRLQVGKGLNPREWIQIGEDHAKPVRSGVLGEWDTEGESGLYVLQLLVVDNDQRVKTSTVQVTIDNTPPTLSIVQPLSGQIIESGPRTSVVIQAQADDDVSLSKVEFNVDGIRLATFYEPPFILSWKPQVGKYTLIVTATDEAGNLKEETTAFIVK